MPRRLLKLSAAIALLAVSWSSPATALSPYFEIVMVPVDRLAANMLEHLKDEPANTLLRLNLARVYVIAYAQDVDQLPAAKGREWEGTRTNEDSSRSQSLMPTAKAPSPAAEREQKRQLNLSRALETYRDVMSVQPGNIYGQLGLAWCLRESGQRDAAIAAYRKTLAMAAKPEAPDEWWSGRFATVIEQEASSMLAGLLDPGRDRNEIAKLNARVTELGRQPRAVSPIAIPLRDRLDAPDLIAPRASVTFDLDGTGKKPWSWINSSAGWLVFDPRGTKSITSALQLFGNVTWWMLWANGYDALRMLDDNFDGTVSGRELDGLAIWRDLNSDGVSQPREVQPLAYWKIVALSYEYRPDRRSLDGMVYSPAGATFADGTTRPTFDLILHLRPTS